jgi:hypothetical protein
MAPGIAMEALGNTKRSLRVLDPMAGSGTVLAVARAKGHKALGIDLDPLAVLQASVWTRVIDKRQVVAKAVEILARARLRYKDLTPGDAYPRGSDEDTTARRQLTALSLSISGVRDSRVRDVLWCGFSRLIISKSAGASRAMDLSHSRPHRKYHKAPVKPFDRFLTAVDVVVESCLGKDASRSGPSTTVTRGDARRVKLKAGTVDLVLTSPPYLNAIDYMRCSKFSLVWMGYCVGYLRQIRAESVGTEAASDAARNAQWVKEIVRELRLRPALSKRHDALLARYVWDMGQAVGEVSRVLKRGGRAVYVVGDSTVRGTFISNSKVVSAVAVRHRLTLKSRQSRSLPDNRRYLPPPKSKGSTRGLNGRMRREVVLEFQKQ